MSVRRLRRINPDLPVLGVEIEPEAVAAAQPFADDLTHFRLGGFNVPLRRKLLAGGFLLIRCFWANLRVSRLRVPARVRDPDPYRKLDNQQTLDIM